MWSASGHIWGWNCCRASQTARSLQVSLKKNSDNFLSWYTAGHLNCFRPRRPRLALLTEVCGRGHPFLWILPCQSPPKDFEHVSGYDVWLGQHLFGHRSFFLFCHHGPTFPLQYLFLVFSLLTIYNVHNNVSDSLKAPSLTIYSNCIVDISWKKNLYLLWPHSDS